MTLDIEDIVDGFDAMARRGRNLRAVWRKLQPVAQQDQREHGRLQEGPDGRWAPLSPATRAQRLKSRRKTARKKQRRIPRRVNGRLLGRIPRLARVRFNRDTFLVISKVSWSGAHQTGETVGRGARLPAREHVYFSDEFLDRVIDAIAEHIVEAF